MIPIEPPEEYGHLVEYGGKNYLPLITREAQGVVTTLWQLSDEERQDIANGKNLFLEMITFGAPLQPVHLWVEGRNDD